MASEQIPLLIKLEALKLPKGEYAIFGSAPLVIRGIKTQSKDLDILVTEKLWTKLTKNNVVQIFANNNQSGEFIRCGKIDFINHLIGFTKEECAEMIKYADIIDGYPFVTLEDIIKWKNILKRDKDLLDIELIKTYIQKDGNV